MMVGLHDLSGFFQKFCDSMSKVIPKKSPVVLDTRA